MPARPSLFPRKRLDLGWLDLAAAFASCALPLPRPRLLAAVEQVFAHAGGGALCCLSVRSALDLYLQALALPHGSEVLMSALTIPDMARVVREHGLVPVPVDVDARTLAPRIGHVEAAAGARTRALLIAHLFGTRIPLEPFAELARARGWLLIEDAAQAYGVASVPHPRTDLALFSFGPIKTRTALGGAVARVASAEVLGRMRALQALQAVQPRAEFAQRVLKYAGLMALSSPRIYRRFAQRCARSGRDLDQVIQGSVRGFPGGDLFEKIRRQPSTPLVALLQRQLASDGAAVVRARTLRAEELSRRLAGSLPLPGEQAPEHTWWVFTVESDDPARTVATLRAAGFDATTAATLCALPAPADRPHLDPREARALLARLVYVPCYPGMPAAKLDLLAQALRSAPAPAATPASPPAADATLSLRS